MLKRLTIFAVLAVLIALPAAAASRTSAINRGIDTWTTVPSGTFADLQNNPIPAGFFCADFPGFSGLIWLKGVPLASDRPSAMGTTDTIVERLDNAVFNKRGVATTRVQVRALQLEGIENLKTSCGEFKVRVTLDGEQPITTMRITRDSAKGGRFLVPLSLNTKLVFTRIDNEAEQFELADPVNFPANPHNRWSYRDLVPDAKRVGLVTVDTDWDGTPDTALLGNSNFYGAANQLKVAMHAGHAVLD